MGYAVPAIHHLSSKHPTLTSLWSFSIGSNNINLLTPSGQFGTRLMGGSDAASPRYIFTHLSPLARLLFPEVDDAVSLWGMRRSILMIFRKISIYTYFNSGTAFDL